MSFKAKLGWALAIAIGTLMLMAITAAQPSWGSHGDDGRVHYYMIAFACNENKVDCIRLPEDEFPTYDKCWEHFTEVKTNELYAIPGHSLVRGKCIGWSPPLSNPEIAT